MQKVWVKTEQDWRAKKRSFLRKPCRYCITPTALLDDRSNIMGPVFVCVQACVHVSANVCGVYAQGGVAEPADRTREVNERLLAEVRRRLQEAKSQLHTGAGAGAGAGAGSPDEVDAGTPVDSPLGGRPKVLQGQASSGTYNYNSNPCILALSMLCEGV